MNSPSKRLLGLVLAIALAVLGITAYSYLMAPPPGVTLANFHTLHPGMTEADVARTFGGPPVPTDEKGDYILREWHHDGHWARVLFVNGVSENGDFREPDGAIHRFPQDDASVLALIRRCLCF
jgi:hypothetical protein